MPGESRAASQDWREVVLQPGPLRHTKLHPPQGGAHNLHESQGPMQFCFRCFIKWVIL